MSERSRVPGSGKRGANEQPDTITLYTWTTPNGRKISIALEEMGLQYACVAVDITRDEQFTPAFGQISPNSKIPVIVDGERRVFESGAILLYLGAKTGRFMPAYASPAYWEMMQWLMWQMSGFGPTLGQAHHFLHYEPGTSAYSETRYRDQTVQLYHVLDRRLASHEFILDSMTIADFAVWPWASRFGYHDVDLRAFPHVARWYLQLAARPAFQRGYTRPLDVGPIPLPD